MKNVIKSTYLVSIREKMIIFLFENSKNICRNLFKKNKKAWNTSVEKIANYPINTLGNDLSVFLKSNGFNLEPKLETHDIYNVLTNYPTTALGEILLSTFNIGTGKKSIYTFGVALIGSIIMLEKLPKIISAFQKGQKSTNYTKWNFEYLLNEDTESLKALLFKKYKTEIQTII